MKDEAILPPFTEDEKKEEKKKDRQVYAPHKAYEIVLYPDCEAHMQILEYLKYWTSSYSIIYILHDKDIIQDEQELTNALKRYAEQSLEYKSKVPAPKMGDEKKAHYHVLVCLNEAMTQTKFNKMLGVSHSEVPTTIDNRIHYYLHKTPGAMHKYQYSISELQGDQKLIKRALNKNLHFVQLAEIAEEAENGLSLSALLKRMGNNPTYQDTFDKYGFYMKAVIDEQQRERWNCYKIAHEDEIQSRKEKMFEKKEFEILWTAQD